MGRWLGCCVCLFALAAAAEVKLPRGWRVPAAADHQGCTAPGDDPYRVVADFDGDGQLDEAQLLIKTSGHTLGLWVWRGAADPVLLFHWPDVADGQHRIGIGLVRGPGSSTTWNGGSISWRLPGIDLYVCEHSNVFVWWDSGRSRFHATQITD